ncbi:hypothetical protein [Burkholderia metallica]|uniref:hypothetical protein n=1 Tax=Burkholderia metallica TaxID=488729 RepID=UPI00157737FC|nr:hypothetical protein [Burkholderia metallica]NTZ05128.1 hypothetical protein [Burkholderia metallica]
MVSANAEHNVQSVVADDGMTSGQDRLFLKSDDAIVDLLVTTVPLLPVWAKTVVLGSSRPMMLPLSYNDTFVRRVR